MSEQTEAYYRPRVTLPEVPLPDMGTPQFVGLYSRGGPLAQMQLAENKRQSKIVEALAFGRKPRTIKTNKVQV